MASLLNTSWVISAVNHDFNTLQVDFKSSGVADVTLDTQPGRIFPGTWTEDGNSFTLTYSYLSPSNTHQQDYDIQGVFQGTTGSGTNTLTFPLPPLPMQFTMTQNQ